MKRFVTMAFFSLFSFAALSLGAQVVGSSHAQSGYNHADISVALVDNPADKGSIWLRATYSYPFLLSEADKFLSLMQIGAKKIDIAVAHKSTISYRQEVGRFSTDDGALVTVTFETKGSAASYVVVEIKKDESFTLLLFDRKDTHDFMDSLLNAHSHFDEYQKQVILFK